MNFILNNPVKKYFSTWFWLIHLVAFIIALFFFKFENEKIYPNYSQKNVLLNTFHEEDSIYHSKVSLDTSSSSLKLNYTLSKELNEPFAGFYFHKSNKDSFFDFSKFDQIKVYIKSDKGKRIPFYLTLNESSFTTPNEVFSNLPLCCIINYTKEGWYVLNKKDFEIPSWWLRDYGLKKSEVFDIDYSRVNYLMLYSCQILSPGITDEIEIKSIQFCNSNTKLYFGFIFFICLFNLVYFLFYKNKKKIVIPYVIQEVEEKKSFKNNQTQIIVDLIAQNYALNDLSMDWIYQKTKIPKREIGNIFKNQFNTSFKEYLNLIRLTESKRLLKETSLSISEIAYLVGYNNVTHFNRVFKEKNGISPSEFKEK